VAWLDVTSLLTSSEERGAKQIRLTGVGCKGREDSRRGERGGNVPHLVHCITGGRQKRGPGLADPRHRRMVLGTWNVTSLAGKEPELVQEVERYQLDMVGLTSMHSTGSGTKLLERGWTLSFSGVAQGVRRQAGVGILTSPRLSAAE